MIIKINYLYKVENIQYATQDGKQIDKELAIKIHTQIEELFEQAKDYSLKIQRDSECESDYKSVADYLYEKYCQLTIEPDLVELTNSFLIWRCEFENSLTSSNSLFDLSIKNYCAYKEFSGCQEVETKYGYKNIINSIIENKSEEFYQRLCLEHELKKIYICSSAIDCKHCLYGSSDINELVVVLNDIVLSKEIIILCKNIVCTMSLGYLKEHLSSIIEPISFISNEKKLAVERIGYGIVNKIFLFYNEKFWSDHINVIRPLWLSSKENVIDKIKKFNDYNWFESIFEIDVKQVDTNEYCLLFWLNGCEFYDKFSDNKISSDLTGLLRNVLNRVDIPEPNKILKYFNLMFYF